MEHREKAVGIVQQAISADNEGKYDEAFVLYLKAFEWFELSLKYEKNPVMFERVKYKLYEYIKRAEELKNVRDGTESSDSYQNSLQSAILTEKPNVKWEDVCGLEEAKNVLRETVIMPSKFPYIFKDGGLKPWKGILLYGPPGTGKSFLAKAVATEANATFFSVSSADLVCKWVGESEKLVKSLFEMARLKKPSIIFIDEVEALCSSRESSDGVGVGGHSAKLLTEFLIQMQGVGKDSDGVLVLGATNLPWALDTAIRRRFEQKIFINLPDREARKFMFKNTGFDLSKHTEGYSGSDISVLINKAKMQTLRTVQTATHFKRVSGISPVEPFVQVEDLFTPCSPGDADAIEMNWEKIPNGKLLIPKVSKRDYLAAVQSTKPTVNQADLKKYEEWTNEFGSEGN